MLNRDGLWQRASKCSGGHCIEVRLDDGQVFVRDSKHPDHPAIPITLDAWAVTLDELRQHGCAHRNGEVLIGSMPDDSVVFHSVQHDSSLVFDHAEQAAFLSGVTAGEFDPALI